MLKTIFFDLGNVLVFFSHPQMIRQIAACTGLDAVVVRKILFEEGFQNRYETGQIDTAQFFRIFQSKSPKLFSQADLAEAASDIFTPNPPLYPIIEQLKNKGLRLILLSNTSECHFAKVKAHYPVLKLFDDFILSYEVGALKPSETIFRKALSSALCPAASCFYTDDVPEFIQGARSAGLDGEVFTGVQSLTKALAARGLNFRNFSVRFPQSFDF